MSMIFFKIAERTMSNFLEKKISNLNGIISTERELNWTRKL